MSTTVAPVRRARSQKKLVFFLIFAALTLFVTYMKNARVFDPLSPIAQHFAPARMYLIVHAFFGSLALALGAFQFSTRIRSRYLKVHRVMGYTYIVGVFLSAPFAIPVAMRLHTMSLVAASAIQSLGWMLCTAIALYCVRTGNIAQHRRWMMRGYPFAMVFTVARLIIPIPAVFKLGEPGIETVVWTTIALAALLPSVWIEWNDITARPKGKLAAAGA